MLTGITLMAFAASRMTFASLPGVSDPTRLAISKLRALVDEILALPEAECQELAREVLPSLLATRAGREDIDGALRGLSDEELDALVLRRQRASALSEEAFVAIIGEGLRAARAEGRILL